ncbi:hypothetical protein K440DRAFT_610072 [Wilcoxina mikolae CBS 423.85]|nr:hypothetical protein K440DRAFT_610072 [Wilcoxina mikolae CBS 423.85]
MAYVRTLSTSMPSLREIVSRFLGDQDQYRDRDFIDNDGVSRQDLALDKLVKEICSLASVSSEPPAVLPNNRRWKFSDFHNSLHKQHPTFFQQEQRRQAFESENFPLRVINVATGKLEDVSWVRGKKVEVEKKMKRDIVQLEESKNKNLTALEIDTKKALAAEMRRSEEEREILSTAAIWLDSMKQVHNERLEETKKIKANAMASIAPFKYAILSHCWLQRPHEEVIYSDLGQDVSLYEIANDLKPTKKESLRKLLYSMKATKSRGLEYIWADTCCIDKSNFTELVESLSSMGTWYINADFCLVFLGDVDSDRLSVVEPTGTWPRWSTRGWTLQEIVLCREAVFYNSQWKNIGDSNNDGEAICKISGLPPNSACKGTPPDYAASTILHWAASRETFKDEDQAYSLMGILGVRMEASYGEGRQRALSRLIDEVVRVKGDVSAFNWRGKDCGRTMYPSDLTGFPSDVSDPVRSGNAISITNAGLYSEFDIIPIHIVIDSEKSYTDDTSALHSILALEKLGDPRDECEVSCTIRFTVQGSGQTSNAPYYGPDTTSYDPKLEATLVCDLWMLKDRLTQKTIQEFEYPHYCVGRIHNLHRRWVLARFAGLKRANWFLCLFVMMGSDTYAGRRIPTDEIFKDPFYHERDLLTVPMYMLTSI